MRNIVWRSAFLDENATGVVLLNAMLKESMAKHKAHVKERQVTAINDPLLFITYHYSGCLLCLAATTNCCRLIDKVLRLRYPAIPRQSFIFAFLFYRGTAKKKKTREFPFRNRDSALRVVSRNGVLKSAIGERVDAKRDLVRFIEVSTIICR